MTTRFPQSSRFLAALAFLAAASLTSGCGDAMLGGPNYEHGDVHGVVFLPNGERAPGGIEVRFASYGENHGLQQAGFGPVEETFTVLTNRNGEFAAAHLTPTRWEVSVAPQLTGCTGAYGSIAVRPNVAMAAHLFLMQNSVQEFAAATITPCGTR